MAMTARKKRKYAVVMLLSAAGLAVNTLMLPDADPAPAVALVADRSVSTMSLDLLPLSIPELPFPVVIRSFDPTVEFRDLFESLHLRDTEALRAAGVPDPTELSAANGRSENGGRERFVREHVLRAVMLRDRLRIAVIDDKLVTIGEEIDGCELADIQDGTVRFECADGSAALELSSFGGLNTKVD
ncbi:MAG: hypothetical protein KJ749_07775 [Planctomycetes bacterium]|nr:hypothetical protein [Planctomycetota bacterium]